MRGDTTATGFVVSTLLRAAALGAFWLVLTGFEADGWWIGLASVALAVTLSLVLVPPGRGRLSARGMAGFTLFFLRESVIGGIDVAMRAFRPSMPIAPGLVRYRVDLPGGAPLLFFGAAVSLLPGTVGAERDETGAYVLHVIDTGANFEETVAALERHIARMFNAGDS